MKKFNLLLLVASCYATSSYAAVDSFILAIVENNSNNAIKIYPEQTMRSMEPEEPIIIEPGRRVFVNKEIGFTQNIPNLYKRSARYLIVAQRRMRIPTILSFFASTILKKIFLIVNFITIKQCSENRI